MKMSDSLLWLVAFLAAIFFISLTKVKKIGTIGATEPMMIEKVEGSISNYMNSDIEIGMQKKPYVIQYGIPIPTNNFPENGIDIGTPTNTLVLNDFPPMILPSGGDSGIISKSEMFAVKLIWLQDVVDPAVHLYFWKLNDGGTQSQIFHAEGSDFAEDETDNSYGGFIGRYQWEIWFPGKYFAEVRTSYGTEIIRFEVI